MVYIKRMMMYGFKSFVRKTELEFTEGINVILGPNGSGKSNISDGLCFVLGRLSIKSMRAAKAKNLIFQGTKAAAPAKEAVVEAVFENKERVFSIDKDEISIKRILRKNGQSIYKINDEVKTRQDILLLLAQAGIDPHGFNIILQGEIQNFARMSPEERRKIIEEVSGISIYESRKEKSLRELEKTEERLKEISAILRERTAYLEHLEKERQQALRFKKLEEDVKKFKASIISIDLNKKKKEAEEINKNIQQKISVIEKIKREILEMQKIMNDLDTKIKIINSSIQKATGFEQEQLNREIADIRAELAGLEVRFQNYNDKLSSFKKQKEEFNTGIEDSENLIKQLKKESPTLSKKQKEMEEKKKILEKLEEERKKFYMTKSEFKSVKERLEDKRNTFQNYSNESHLILKQIEMISSDLFDIKTNKDKLDNLKKSLIEKRTEIEKFNEKDSELSKSINLDEYEIKKLEKLKEDISKIDICPLCKSKITQEHIKSINEETNPRIKELQKKIEHAKNELDSIKEKREKTKKDIENINIEMTRRESDLIKISNIDDKKEQLKSLQEKIDRTKQELSILEKRNKILEENFDENSDIEKRYENIRLEIQEISVRNEENIGSEINFKQVSLERFRINLKQIQREEEDLNEEIKSMRENLKNKGEILKQKNEQEEELRKRFKKMIEERDSLQQKLHEYEKNILQKQNDVRGVEQEINEMKIDKAKVDAEQENLEIDMLNYPNIETIKMSRENLAERLSKTQEILANIGMVNLRSLEVYDSMKKEYDSVKEKSELISKEKEGIMKIIHEIDIKKKKTFNNTMDSLNEIFSRNFAQLNTKGQVFLEVEDKKNPFESGVSIVVKTGQGKYFDVTSLSGGEQTLVAISLIFAIQEYKPYYFYILDEIDAALDKRNSERLADLLKKYMQKGQYIVISHNDEIISNATSLYGITMHEGISKITSLKI